MKYKVIKEFAGIVAGTEMEISDSRSGYMIEAGYVEPIEEKSDPKPRGRKKKVDVEADNAQNKSE